MQIREIIGSFGWRQVLCTLLSSLLLFAVAPAVLFSQTYPSKPITLYVPYPPGGGTDALARIIAPKLGEVLGQQVVIDNRGGAGGTVGTAIVARAPADGYSLDILNTMPHTAVAGLYTKLSYDPVKDFSGIGMIAITPYLLAVNPSVPAKTFAEFLALARSKPGTLYYGSSGVGGSNHLVAEVFKSVTKVDLKHVPYKGGGPATVDLLGGHIQLEFDNIVSLSAHCKSGKLRCLAVTSMKRYSMMPDVPTIAESGYPDFEVVGQYGFAVPAGTPRAIINRLNADLNKVMKDPAMIQKLESQGAEPSTSTPERFDEIIKADSEKWLGLIRKLGIKPE